MMILLDAFLEPRFEMRSRDLMRAMGRRRHFAVTVFVLSAVYADFRWSFLNSRRFASPVTLVYDIYILRLPSFALASRWRRCW